jgi:hypothetical protein
MDEQVIHDTAPMDADAPLAEVTKIKETAERMANGDYPQEADQTRVLAGMIHHLAEQIERLSNQSVGAGPETPLRGEVGNDGPTAPLSHTPED